MFPCASVISDVSVISDFSGRFPARRRFSIGIPDVSGRNSGCFEIWVSEWGVRYFSCGRGSERGRGGGRERERERARDVARVRQDRRGRQERERERSARNVHVGVHVSICVHLFVKLCLQNHEFLQHAPLDGFQLVVCVYGLKKVHFFRDQFLLNAMSCALLSCLLIVLP